MKWYSYIICVLLIFLGTFFGIQFFKEFTAKSYVNGSIDILNKYSQESFNYSSTSLTFYHNNEDTTDTYYFDNNLLKVGNFNGNEKNYKVTLNEFPIVNANIQFGSVNFVVVIDFYDTNGEAIISNAELNVSIKFLSNKTNLLITTIGKDNAQYFEQYFIDNGIRLLVTEIL